MTIPTYAANNHGIETDARGLPVFRSSVTTIDPLWIVLAAVAVWWLVRR